MFYFVVYWVVVLDMQTGKWTLQHSCTCWTSTLVLRSVSRTLWTRSKLMIRLVTELFRRPSYDTSSHSSVTKWPARKVPRSHCIVHCSLCRVFRPRPWPRGQIFWPWPWDFWPWPWGFWPCVSGLGLIQSQDQGQSDQYSSKHSVSWYNYTYTSLMVYQRQRHLPLIQPNKM